MVAITLKKTSSDPSRTVHYHDQPFFPMGFMIVFIDTLIPRFKEAFTLDYYHAMFVQLVCFSAYFLGSLLYFIISATQGDLIAKIGHKMVL